MDDELTPGRVAEELGVTVRTVQRWIRDGRLPARQVGGRFRVARTSLNQVRRRPAGEPWRPIRSLLIANRGEVASRIARTARMLRMRATGVTTPDEPSPPEIAESATIPSYLDGEAIVAAALAAGADAIHPGYGFLAESAEFAEMVSRAGVLWVGPPPTALAAMGDKAAARRRAAAAGVPVLRGYDGEAQDDATLAAEARKIGYPLLVKPTAGGGGKGMRAVRDAAELRDAVAASRREALRAFGNDRLLLERLVERARHVEIQVLFDAHGGRVHLGERDCSTQRRNQKVVEEAPSPAVTPELRERMGAAALAVAASVGYVNAGTAEFLLADDGSFAFLEMNARLQVEHAVTEAVTGRDLVADQLRIAAGEPLGISQRDVRLRGHAIEARLYAEDPEAGFLPASGRVVHLRWPTGGGIRVDAGVRPGETVSDRYDPMLAKIIAAGDDRGEAIDRLRAALDDTELLGVTTNLRFLRWLLEQPDVVDGEVRTDTLASLHLPPAPIPGNDHWRAAAVGAAALLPSGPWGGGWRLNAPPLASLALDGLARRVPLPLKGWTAPGPVAVDAADGSVHVGVEGRSLAFQLASPPTVESALRRAAGASSERATLTAPMPGRVVAVRSAEGSVVEAGAPVIVIEAMKMEHAVTSPLAGRIARLAVAVGDQVQRGDRLAEVSVQVEGDESDTLRQ